MATATAAVDAAIGAIAPTKPVIGQPVALALYDGNHKVHAVVGHVLSITAKEGQPELSVAYPDPNANQRVFGGPAWASGYIRRTSVKHYTDPAVQSGRESICWSTTVEPTIPTPAGDPAKRLERQPLPEVEKVSVEQAVAVQTGKAPQPSTQSPVINESEQSQIEHPVTQAEPQADDG